VTVDESAASKKNGHFRGATGGGLSLEQPERERSLNPQIRNPQSAILAERQ